MGMFDDFFSSSKGPGVLGIILGVIVLGGFGALGLAVFDGRLNGDFRSDAEKEAASQASAIEGLQGTLKHLEKQRVEADQRAKLVEQLNGLQKQLTFHQENVTRLEGDVKAAQDSITDVEGKFEDYKAAYRKAERTAAKGEEFKSLELQNGDVLTDVVVREVNDIGMQVRMRTGSRTIAQKDLPENLRDRFQFTDALTAAALAKVEKREKVAEVDQGRQALINQVRALKAEKASKNDQIRQLSREATSLQKSIQVAVDGAVRDETRAQEIRARGGKNQLKTLDQSARNKRARALKLKGELSQKKDAIGKLQREISQIDSKVSSLERQINEK